MSFRLGIMARRAVTVAALAGVSLMSACGDSSGPNSESYALYSVDEGTGAQVLPIVGHDYFVTGDTYTLKSGTLNLNDGKYTVRIVETYKASSTAALETYTYGENGTYVISGADITLTSTHDFDNGDLTPVDVPSVTTGTKDGTTLTFDVGGDIYVFKK